MGGSSAFQILTMIFMLLSGGKQNHDMLDMISADSYWRVKGVTVTVEQLEVDANGGPKVTEDIGKLVQDLSAADFATRDGAKGKLAAVGTPALAALKTAADSKDAEVAAAAEELIKQISTHVKDRDIRALMAIRTLGEHKEKAAIATLKPLTESKTPFVAEYAQRAIAQINGEEWRAPDRHAAMAPDVAMLPADSGLVGQTVGLGIPGMTLEKIAADVVSAIKPEDMANDLPLPMPGQMQPPQAPAMPDKAKVSDKLVRELIAYAERIGDMRADGVTFAVSDDLGGKKDWVMLNFRGEYDRKAVVELVQEMLSGKQDEFFGMACYRAGDTDIIEIEGMVAFVMPSDHQLVFMLCERGQSSVGSLLIPFCVALETGKTTLDANKDISALAKAADKNVPAWAVGHLPPALKKEMPFLDAFDSVIATSKEEKEGIAITISAKASPGAADGIIKTALDELTKGFNSLVRDALSEVTREKEMQIVADLFKSAKAAASPEGITVTGTVPLNLEEALLAELRHQMSWMIRDLDETGGPGNVGMGGREVVPPAPPMPVPPAPGVPPAPPPGAP